MVLHVYNRAIEERIIFNDDAEFIRMKDMIGYYRYETRLRSFSGYCKAKMSAKNCSSTPPDISFKQNFIVNVIAYCIMPTHLHLILEEISAGGISDFISNLLNSYSRYFNTKYNRKGALWEGRSSKVHINTDEHLLHLTRYIHLNPVTAYLVEKPENWPYSSYQEYISTTEHGKKLCNYSKLMEIDRIKYKKFVEDGITYQRELAKI